MTSISIQEQHIIRRAMDNMDKVVNTLAYVEDDNETELQIKSLVGICIYQINRDINSLNAMLNPDNEGK